MPLTSYRLALRRVPYSAKAYSEQFEKTNAMYLSLQKANTAKKHQHQYGGLPVDVILHRLKRIAGVMEARSELFPTVGGVTLGEREFPGRRHAGIVNGAAAAGGASSPGSPDSVAAVQRAAGSGLTEAAAAAGYSTPPPAGGVAASAASDSPVTPRATLPTSPVNGSRGGGSFPTARDLGMCAEEARLLARHPRRGLILVPCSTHVLSPDLSVLSLGLTLSHLEPRNHWSS